MKKIVFAILMVASVGLYSQTHTSVARAMVSEFIEETNAYQLSERIKDHDTSIVVELPQFYNFDLLRRASRNISDAYSDITVKGHWRRMEQNKYLTVWTIDNSDFVLFIFYDNSRNYLMIACEEM